jgi:Fic family protein
MKRVYQPRLTYTPKILSLIEEIAGLKGRMDGMPVALADEVEIRALANRDAVHFSTKLEGNALTLEQVTQALAGRVKKRGFSGHDLKEVLNYSKARKSLLTKPQPVTLGLILKTHDILMSGIVRGKLKGHLREVLNVIHDSGTRTIVYMPPVPDDVPGLMKSLLQWLRREFLSGTSSLIVAPVFHYAFVTIHPFMDGNGRLARLLANHILETGNYAVNHFAALEKQHELDRPVYYNALRKLQSHNFYDIPENIDLSSWIEYWLECLKKTYDEALSRLNRQNSSFAYTRIHAITTRLERAISLFHKHKTLRAADYEVLMNIGRTQAVADLSQLIKSGRIIKVGGGRSTLYQVKK